MSEVKPTTFNPQAQKTGSQNQPGYFQPPSGSPRNQKSSYRYNQNQNQNQNQQSRPTYQLRTPIEQITLSTQQQLKISQIESKIRELNERKAPSKEEFTEKEKVISDKIYSLSQERSQNQYKIEEIETRKRQIAEKDSPQTQLINSKKSKLVQINAEIKKNIELVQQKKKKIEELINNKKQSIAKLPVRTYEDAINKIEEIDEKIETESLSNTDLKFNLSLKARIEEVLPLLEKFKDLDQQIQQTKAEQANIQKVIEQLTKEKKELQKEFDELNIPSSSKEELDKLKEEGNKLRELEKSLQIQIQEQREELSNVKKQSDALFSEHGKINKEINELNYEKIGIYKNAEKLMFQIANQNKQISEIKGKVNPNSIKINTCKALIPYLEQFLQHENKTKSEEPPKPIVKNLSGEKGKEAAALIESIRKNPKSGRKNKKTSIVISHSLNTVNQFSTLDLLPPRTIPDVPEMLETLKKKIDDLEKSFVSVDTLITYLPDGHVELKIALK